MDSKQNSSHNLVTEIKRGYEFLFNINGISIRAGGSAVSGKEYVYVNDRLVSAAKNQSLCSTHNFSFEAVRYTVQFEILNKLNGVLACRLYCDNVLTGLYVAKPRLLPIIGPVTAVIMVLALYANDIALINVPFYFYIILFLSAAVISIYYSLNHIEITEFEV